MQKGSSKVNDVNARLVFSRLARIMKALIIALATTTHFSDASPIEGAVGVTAKDSVAYWPEPSSPAGAPNIVVILLDDVGYAASEVFGGPVRTPKLQELAKEGLRYNRFHVPAICSATRAALLTGRNDHQTGFGLIADAPKGFPGYNGIWPKSVAPVSEVLRQNGYSTAAFGKWHNTPPWEINPLGPFDRWPTGLGFDYFYGSMSGFDSQWQPARLYRNTIAIAPPRRPEDGYHFTTDITDQAISWLHTLEALSPEKPYFLYFATGATHAPFQVPRTWTNQYKGEFDEGWDKLREQIFKRQKELGIVPNNAKLTPRPSEFPAWEALSEGQKRLSAREMEVFAGFLSHTDHEVGRLLDAVRRGPRARDTLILYIAGDNGASGMPAATATSVSGEDGWLNPNLEQKLKHLDELGTYRSSDYVSYSDPWAWATNTPFQWTKIIASHFGGTRVPLVVSWPSHIKHRGSMRSQFTHANDIAATLLDIAGIPFPQQVNGVEQVPLAGVSFAYTFDSPDAPSRHRTQVFEQAGNRAIYHDGWIASSKYAGFFEQMKNPDKEINQTTWELYHIDQDFSQAINLAGKHPKKLAELKILFDEEARKNNIYPLLNFFDKSADRPSKVRQEYIFHLPMPRLPGQSMPNLTHSSYSFTTDVIIPESGAEGVIVFYGSDTTGFALYVQGDHLIYESRPAFKQTSDVMVSSKAVPRGKVTFRLAVTQNKKNGKNEISDSEIRMYINDDLVGKSTLPPRPQEPLSSFGAGQALSPSFSKHFEPPYTFSGSLDKIYLRIDDAASISFKSSE